MMSQTDSQQPNKVDASASTDCSPAVRKAADALVGWVLSCGEENTPEWMDGLADKINEYAEAISDEDRVQRHRTGLRILRGVAT